MISMCSIQESGTAAGASGSARSSPLELRASTSSIRRSSSRTSDRNFPIDARSTAPSAVRSRATSPAIRSSMLRRVSLRSARSSGEYPCPKIRSKAVRGLRIAGSGFVGRRPTEPMGIKRMVAAATAPGVWPDVKLKGRKGQLLPVTLGVQLINRTPDEDITSSRLLRVGLGEEHRSRTMMAATDLLWRPCLGHLAIRIGHDRQVLAKILEGIN